MKKEQLAVALLILLAFLGLYFFGRPDSRLPLDGFARSTQMLKQHKVPVLAITSGSTGQAAQYLAGVRQATSHTPPDRVVLVHVDVQNPNEEQSLHLLHGKPVPRVMVVGLDGHATYEVAGQYDPAALKKAIEVGLTKKPMAAGVPCDPNTCDTCGP